ncbi:MAG: YlxR family protein [Oscillospiraceae bacterium]|nr:YlxR family protein [Oscillospiraceae bacterium]
MCVACRVMRPKRELARVVRPPEGVPDAAGPPPDKPRVTIDATGKLNGRGAYLCRDAACLAKARKSRALERALNTSLDADAYERLAALIEQ